MFLTLQPFYFPFNILPSFSALISQTQLSELDYYKGLILGSWDLWSVSISLNFLCPRLTLLTLHPFPSPAFLQLLPLSNDALLS